MRGLSDQKIFNMVVESFDVCSISQLSDTLRLLTNYSEDHSYFRVYAFSISTNCTSCIYRDAKNHHKLKDNQSGGVSLQLFGASDSEFMKGHVFSKILRWLTMRSASWSRC